MKDVEVMNKQFFKNKPEEVKLASELQYKVISDSLKDSKPAEYILISYHYHFRSVLDRMGCQEVKIQPPELPRSDFELPHFPYKLWSDGTDLYLMAPSNDDVNSDFYSYPIQVFEINGILVKDLLPYFLAISELDGNEASAGIRFFNGHSTLIAREYFNEVDTFEIKMRGQTLSEVPQNRVYSKGYKITSDQYLTAKTQSKGGIVSYDLKLIKRGTYARISSFADLTNDAMDTMANRLNETDKKYLIIDLRGTSDRNEAKAIELGYYFNKPGLSNDEFSKLMGAGIGDTNYDIEIFSKWLEGDTFQNFKPASAHFEGEVYVIVDGYTQSSAAQFAAIMQIQSLAVIVGEETGSMFVTSNSKDISTIKLPASKAFGQFPSEGKSHHLDGIITPDLYYHHSARSIIEQKDKVLESVIQHIKTTP